MKKLHRRKNLTNQIESKEGQRNFLCSNKGDGRCPSLGLNSNNELVTDDMLLDFYASLLVRASMNKIRNERAKKQ